MPEKEVNKDSKNWVDRLTEQNKIDDDGLKVLERELALGPSHHDLYKASEFDTSIDEEFIKPIWTGYRYSSSKYQLIQYLKRIYKRQNYSYKKFLLTLTKVGITNFKVKYIDKDVDVCVKKIDVMYDNVMRQDKGLFNYAASLPFKHADIKHIYHDSRMEDVHKHIVEYWWVLGYAEDLRDLFDLSSLVPVRELVINEGLIASKRLPEEHKGGIKRQMVNFERWLSDWKSRVSGYHDDMFGASGDDKTDMLESEG